MNNIEKIIKYIEELFPEAFATIREASRRVLGMYPFRVQIMGAAALNEGNIAEMKTGEGKTLTSTMAVYLNAITGKGGTVKWQHLKTSVTQ